MNPINEQTQKLLKQLFEKFHLSGQDTNDYLEGLLVSHYEPYWDYILLDSLLSLQKPKTPFRDEMIFVVYHQITELYFKLVLHEIQGLDEREFEAMHFKEVLVRINRYIKLLVDSFDVMVDGMYKHEFLKFRMALLPASGFQSAQFRMIEFCTTPVLNLLSPEDRKKFQYESISVQYDHVYWKKGAIDLESGKKTLTLEQFEIQYDKSFQELIEKYRGKTLYDCYLQNKNKEPVWEEIKSQLRKLDIWLNINWRLSHYRSAVRYLQRSGGDVSATGGTNWQKYLPPRFQKIFSFPDLWSPEEKEQWGKTWVEEQLTSNTTS